jgi:hypothetical protein
LQGELAEPASNDRAHGTVFAGEERGNEGTLNTDTTGGPLMRSANGYLSSGFPL